MPRKKKIQWSPHDHSMKGFMELMSPKLPTMAKVTQGYCGTDWDMHSFSSDEQYWICKVMKQERVLLSDTKGHNVSIPTSYKDHQFQIMTNGWWSPPYPLTIVVDKWKDSDDDDMRIRVNNDEKINFQAGQDAILQATLGVLTFFDIYDERYFLGHSLDTGEPHPDPVIIPAYMTIRLTEAIGLTNSTEDEFYDFRDKIREYVKQFDYPPEIVQGNKEVMIFDGDMGKGDYDYIHPKCPAEIYGTVSEATAAETRGIQYLPYEIRESLFPRHDKNKKKFDWPMEFEEKKEDPSLGPKQPTPPLPIRNKSLKAANSLDRFIKSTHNPIVPLVQTQRRVPSPPTHTKPVTISSGAGNAHSGMEPPSPKPRVPKPRRDLPSHLKSNAYTNVSLQNNKPVIQIQPVAPTQHGVVTGPTSPYDTPLSPTNGPKPQQTFAWSSVSKSSAPPDKYRPIQEIAPPIVVDERNENQDCESVYGSLKDVPKDKTTLTITELASALRFLKLGQYSDIFINQDIDGKLLSELGEDILVEEFEFRRLEAKKLMMWIRGDWEPQSK